MIGKISLVLAFATLASCGVVQQRVAPVVTRSIAVAKVAKVVEVEPADAFPRYNFGYSIKDALTGDSKSQFESRDGENVKGEYSVVEPDGTLRVVTYTAGAEGFNAVINRKAGFAAPIPFIEQKPIVTPVQNTIPAASIIHQQKLVVPVQQQQKVQFVQQQPQVVVAQPQPVFVQQPQPIFVQEPQPEFVEQQPHPIPVQPQPQPIPVQQQPQPIPVQQQPQPIPVQQQPQPIPVQQQPQPIPVQQQPQPQPIPVQQQPQPQPIPVQQQPQPIPVQQQPQPIPVQQQPRPQPPPVQQPQQQFQPRPQPPPQPQPLPVQHDQQDPDQADDSAAIVVEAAGRSARAQPRRAAPNGGARPGSGSSFTYSSRGRAYDFNIAY